MINRMTKQPCERYSAYESLAKVRCELTLVGCWAHPQTTLQVWSQPTLRGNQVAHGHYQRLVRV